jgi:hypothetical protein
MRTIARSPTIGSMRITIRNRKDRRLAKRAGAEAAQTLSVAAQMALLCPSGMDIWMQRELAGCFEQPRHDGNRRR